MARGMISTIRPNRDDGYGYGTILPDGGGPSLVFYSRSVEGTMQALTRLLYNLRHPDTRRGEPFEDLAVGQQVMFVVGEDALQHGRAYAEQVRPGVLH